MFDNVAIDVVIGLVFVYLLYSLLATILAEMLASGIALRAFNLREAVDRMLSDEDQNPLGWRRRLLNTLKLIRIPDSAEVNNFYEHPEIKYLGSTRLLHHPSSFKGYSFAKTVLNLLNGSGPVTIAAIRKKLEQLNSADAKEDKDRILGKRTAGYVLSLLDEAGDSVEQFRLNLESWFDRTMEQALEWYKRKIQVILLVIGFSIAWGFGVDTIDIAKKLATDKIAREKIVAMADVYNRQPEYLNLVTADSVSTFEISRLNARLDSLAVAKKELKARVDSVSEVLGIKHGDFKDHALGYLLTAFAISLGAPFWFDLLNKVMRLRTNVKQGTQTAGKSPVEAQ